MTQSQTKNLQNTIKDLGQCIPKGLVIVSGDNFRPLSSDDIIERPMAQE